ncbi:MAG: DNA polymerase I, partial [Myxococcales bacterium]|nr:DNA polymerase I [Myxococcales bacterium]
MSRPRLYVVDGHNQIFRAFYAIRGMTRADGQATNAIYGFTSTLRKLIQDENPDLLAVTFDTAAGSFRKDLYSEYKANRSAPPEDLIPQFSIIRDVVKAYNIAALELEGWEADDLMATLAVQGERAGLDVTIVSTDKDLCQLVTEHVHLLNPMKNKRLGRAEVVEKMGVPPEQVTDLQGLCGDSSDNIPGVPGIGMKTAAKLIDSYHNIEGIYEAIDAGDKAIKGKRLENLV